MSTPYTGGAGFPDDENLGRNETGSYGTENYGTGSYESTYPTGENYSADAYDVNASHGALRYHGTTIVDGKYGDGVEPHPLSDPATNGWHHLRGTGKLNPVEAWGFGLKATFANWQVWIGFGLFAVVVLGGLSVAVPFLGNLLSIALVFLYPVLYSFALMSTLAKRWSFDGLKAPRYGLTLGVMVVVGLIAIAVGLVVLGISFALFGGTLMDAAETIDPATMDEGDLEDMKPLMLAILKVFSLSTLIMLLFSPFFVFAPWYAADSAEGFGGSLKQGFSAGARNYLQLILFQVLSFLITIVGALLLGIGLVVVVPASILATAYAYRQVSGGPVPHDD